jgi:tetratricopeptide (TPR) repeat protein
VKVVRICFLALGVSVFAALAASNRLDTVTGAPSSLAETNQIVAREFSELMETDDAAAEEIDGWILENQKFALQGAGVPREELNRRIRKRQETVRAAYLHFIRRHPDYARARLAFASFLEDIQEDGEALEQLLKAKEINPGSPVVWNNLANYYGQNGPVTNAFAYYQKAIDLDPRQSVYYRNFGATVFLFRHEAAGYFGISEQQAFDKGLLLYSNAQRLAPTNFLLAADIAAAYYGIKPPRYEQALKAWNTALELANGSLQKGGVQIHLARVNLGAGNLAEARANLAAVTNAELAELKSRLLQDLEAKEHEASGGATNPVPSLATNTPAASRE